MPHLHEHLVKLLLADFVYFCVYRSEAGFQDWAFSTVRCWGEDPTGVWTILITDHGICFTTYKLDCFLKILYFTDNHDFALYFVIGYTLRVKHSYYDRRNHCYYLLFRYHLNKHWIQFA